MIMRWRNIDISAKTLRLWGNKIRELQCANYLSETLCLQLTAFHYSEIAPRVLRSCLSKNRKLNFGWKIFLPETLASERLYREGRLYRDYNYNPKWAKSHPDFWNLVKTLTDGENISLLRRLDFRGPSVQALPYPSRVSPACARSSLSPTTSRHLLRRLIFPSPGNFHHNHSSIIVLQYWRTQNVCNISKTNFFVINQKKKTFGAWNPAFSMWFTGTTLAQN